MYNPGPSNYYNVVKDGQTVGRLTVEIYDKDKVPDSAYHIMNEIEKVTTVSGLKFEAVKYQPCD